MKQAFLPIIAASLLFAACGDATTEKMSHGTTETNATLPAHDSFPDPLATDTTNMMPTPAPQAAPAPGSTVD